MLEVEGAASMTKTKKKRSGGSGGRGGPKSGGGAGRGDDGPFLVRVAGSVESDWFAGVPYEAGKAPPSQRRGERSGKDQRAPGSTRGCRKFGQKLIGERSITTFLPYAHSFFDQVEETLEVLQECGVLLLVSGEFPVLTECPGICFSAFA